MSSIKYDYEPDLELNFSDNIGYQSGEIANLLIEAQQLNLSSFEFADIMDTIAIKEDIVFHMVKDAQKLGIEFDYIKNLMKEFDAEKKQIIIARDNRYGTQFYDAYYN